MVKVGVVLAGVFDDPGDYLADARALEVAEVDSIWVQAVSAGDLLLAAIAAVTSRIRLGLLAVTSDEAAAFAARLEILQRLSRSRALVGIAHGDLVEVKRPAPEQWQRVAVPKDRAEWQRTLTSADSAKVTGVLVNQDPRLLDLLRRPLEEDDRTDLLLSQG